MEKHAAIAPILEKIAQAQKIVITSHKSPDGDSIGSSLALYHYLISQAKQVEICHPDQAPTYLQWLTGADKILNFDSHSNEICALIESSDLVFALDYNHPSRVGKMSDLIEKSGSKTIMIDHHLDPSPFAFLQYSEPSSCSTAQLIYELISADENLKLTAEIGEPIYLGIMTDTGSFRFSSVTARTHHILAELLENRIQHSKIHEAVYDQTSLNQLKLKSYALNQKLEIIEQDRVALLSLTADELARYNYKKGDDEGLVNTALGIQGVKMAIFLAEKDNAIKISFRSKADLKVNTLAADCFEGGGHANAAGGISFISMEETLKKLKNELPKYI